MRSKENGLCSVDIFVEEQLHLL